MVELQEPVWVTEYKEKILKLKAKTTDGELYSIHQRSLKILKKTGKGNCEATVELFMEILKKHGVKEAYVHWVFPRNKQEDESGHQCIFVHEGPGKIWMQNNDEVLLFKGEYDANWYLENALDWEERGMQTVFVYPVDQLKKARQKVNPQVS